MAIKIKIPKRNQSGQWGGPRPPVSFLGRPLLKIALAAALLLLVCAGGVFAHYYVKYERIVTHRIAGHLFSNAAKIYARPEVVWMGESIAPDEIAGQLRRAGYSEVGVGAASNVGTYSLLSGGGIEIRPGADSYHNRDGAIVRISDGKVSAITGTGSAQGASLSGYELEPLLITALESQERSKRQLVRYQDIPPVMVNAVLAIEDRRFFQHGGVNYLRMMESAWVDLREHTRGQGGSTITMQVSRMFFLSPEKTIKRKLTEMLIATELEQRLSKQQIFELYANQVDMGQRGSFTIRGFAEAARAYFNKDLQGLTLPEAALLAGLIQRPSYLSPYRHPDRALERRNLVLETMVETGAITREQCEKAKAAPLKLAPPNVEASDAPYFVDLVKDSLSGQYGDRELNENSYRIYTTLDTDLQKAAADAVQIGIKQVDEQVNKLRTRRVKVGAGRGAKYETKLLPGPQAQVALVCIDPHTGEVLALVGGRNYAFSQLDHATARRPTGSVFKPFVYATAVNTGLNGGANILTPASMIDDSPTTFTYGDQIYEPRNYKDEYHGMVSAQYALAHSLNNATVKLAEEVGYDNVANLARAAGLKSVEPTPAMALGAYDATPMDVASAYTIFANGGLRLTPVMVTALRDAKGKLVDSFQTQKTQVLDSRVAYVMTNMMEAVVNSGTAAGVRGMGFTAPAAGKTGTSHDGWFAGYTSNLLTIVWVGFDDYSDLRLSGATTAAPIWAEFMKRAVALPEYRDVQEFNQPSGVVDVTLDKASNRLATASCPDDYSAAFIEGTEPKDTCDQALSDHRGFFSRIFGIGAAPPPAPNPPAAAPTSTPPAAPGQRPATPTASSTPPPPPPSAPEPKKKGIFGKIVGIFKDSPDDDSTQSPRPDPGGNPAPR